MIEEAFNGTVQLTESLCGTHSALKKKGTFWSWIAIVCLIRRAQFMRAKYTFLPYCKVLYYPFPFLSFSLSSLSSLPVFRKGKKKSSREEQGTSLLSDLRRTTLRVTHRNLSTTPKHSTLLLPLSSTSSATAGMEKHGLFLYL